MKAIVNIGFRLVHLEYTLKEEAILKMHFNQATGRVIPIDVGNYGDWSTFKKSKRSQVICIQSFAFKDPDEWLTIKLLDGRIIDLHYDYENSSEFLNKKEWGEYIFQGYEYTEGMKQTYDKQIIEKVQIIF